MMVAVRLDHARNVGGRATVVEIVQDSNALAFETALLKYNEDPEINFWEVPTTTKVGDRLSLKDLLP